MKKAVSLICVLIFLLNKSSAQQQENPLVFGFKVGTNYSDAYEQRGVSFNTTGKLGIVAGGFLTISMGDYFALQPEILFAQKGFKATGSLSGNTYDVTRTKNYIDLPLLIALKPTPFVTVLGGPQYSYLLKQNDAFKSNTLNAEQQGQFTDNNVRRNIFAIVGGVDIVLQQFVIGARLGWDVKNNNLNQTVSTPQYKNAWAQATLGFKIF